MKNPAETDEQHKKFQDMCTSRRTLSWFSLLSFFFLFLAEANHQKKVD